MLLLTLFLHSCLVAQDKPTLHGRVEAFSQGHALLIEMLTRDTLGKAPILNHVFVIEPDEALMRPGVTPAMLLCIQDDHRASTAAPVALEYAQIVVDLKSGYPVFSGSPLQQDFSELVKQMMELHQQVADRDRGTGNDSIYNTLDRKLDDFYLSHRQTELALFASLVVSDQIERNAVDPLNFPGIRALCNSSSIDSNDLRVCEALDGYATRWAGAAAKPFEGSQADGSRFQLSDHIGKEVILIDFWASWCGPCIREMPQLQEVARDFDLLVVSISIDVHEQSWLDALERLQLPWIHLRDADASIKKLYQVTSIPTMFLIDKSGTIISRNPQDLRELLVTLR